MTERSEVSGTGVLARGTESPGLPNVRSLELANFLRGQREALTPHDVGLPTTRRRRTPGLRREEVAELAEISTSLYTWLEQGRDVAISKRTIESVAQALRFTPSQRRHLYTLASPQDVELDETVTPALRRLVDSMRAHPVFVLDHTWDIVALNQAATTVFHSESAHGPASEAKGPNFLEHIFLNLELRANCIDWDELAADIVALYRYHFASYTADSRAIAVVDDLRTRSPLFAELWAKHVIRPSPRGMRTYRHPVAGMLCFEPTVYAVIESTGLWLLVYCPVDDETTERVDVLVRSGSALTTEEAGLPVL